MTQILRIPGRLPGLNDYTGAERTNKYKGAKMKRECTDFVATFCKQQKVQKFKKPVIIKFVWIEPNTRRDPDNFTSFGRKVILDGLVRAGILPDDSQKWVKGWSDGWKIDKENPEIYIIITEANNV